MKTLRTSSPYSEEWLRFMNEGQVHHEMRHPNIAVFHEMFLCNGQPCMVMEYVDGETVFTRIRRAGPLAVGEALAVTTYVCDALSYLHERGVLHRDVKSANVKITSTGVVKLLDFGIAKRQRARGLTVDGTVVGTPEYLAPEQLSGMPPDVRSEIWALGLLIYEMLTGRLPFTGDEAALYEAIRGTVPAPPSAWNQAVPPEVDALVMRCLEKRPSRRFQAVSEVKTGTPAAPGFAQRLREKLWRK
jgi:serine/threonine-protein kinase